MSRVEHEREHELIAKAIEEKWLDYAMLLVHLASRHGLTVKDVDNSGLVPLLQRHDALHGRTDGSALQLHDAWHGRNQGGAMTGIAFIHLVEDRLTIKADQIVAVRELGESDLDVRTGDLRLGIPKGSLAEISTHREKYYVRTEHDDVVALLYTAYQEPAR